MNFVFLSPSFPPNYRFFCDRLKRAGASVLGIGEEPFHSLVPELRSSLAWYYQVGNMRDPGALREAMRFFMDRFGQPGRIDSLNEYWLETEALLRTEFGVPGIKAHEVPSIRRKSRMMEIFERAGVPHARGAVVPDAAAAKGLAARLKFPLVVKPDDGMGAEMTYRLDSARDLERFFGAKPDRDFILQEFIEGSIVTFDGLADLKGRIVFSTSHVYGQGVMESVLSDSHISYYSMREVPRDLEEAGRRLVEAFGVRERFFHLEFFRRPDGSLCALEANIRPPGGPTMDMFNFACDIDMYSVWAGMMTGCGTDLRYERKYHCGYISRKNRLDYAYPHERLMDMLGGTVAARVFLPPVLARAMGDEGYIVRTRDEGDMLRAVDLIQKAA